jgi:hypothetical protein
MAAHADTVGSRREPRRGDAVRVRSREEILATLDETGSLGGLPFMPEMLDYAGQELTVWARSDTSCDLVSGGGHRQMQNTIHLDGARCSGAAHGGCEARCLLFWREEWLQWSDAPGRPIKPAPPQETSATETTLANATIVEPGPEPRYSCQATEHSRASAPTPRRTFLSYAVRDYGRRNFTFSMLVKGLAISAMKRYQRLSKRVLPSFLLIRGGRDYPFIIPTGTGERLPATEFQPGDLVEIRSKEEIVATLGSDQRNRSLHFDEDMLDYCGRRARILGQSKRIIDDITGRVVKLRDCYVLEGVMCVGLNKRFCQRAITPYWRSGWLKKVDPALGPSRPLAGQVVTPRQVRRGLGR